jgi:hypothetical protein
LIGSHLENVYLWKQAHGNPNNPLEVTNQNALNMLSDRYMNNVVGFAPAGITAFHGTPHNILGKFDINKVGTGEGAQAYGHGMYFAENPSVAKEYLVNAQSQKTPEGMARSYVKDYPSEKEALIGAKERLQRLQQNGTPDLIQQQEQIIKALESNQLGGNLYKVDIPDEYIPKMLDWDKPLKEQTNILEGLLSKESGFTGQTKQEIQELVKKGANGEDLIDLFGQNQKELSDELSKLGIKGIRYLDEGSRNQAVQPYYQLIRKSDNSVYTQMQDLKKAEEFVKDAKSKGVDFEISAPVDKRTSNFVVFDPTDIKILERNSQPVEGLLD